MKKALRIAVVAGDGIGIETTREALKVLDTLKASGRIAAEVTSFPWGADHFLKTGETVPDSAFAMLQKDFDAILVGAFGDPRVPDPPHAERNPSRHAGPHLDLINPRPVGVSPDSLSPR
jgi:isocitrate/isopropylmalate dehydrogenase